MGPYPPQQTPPPQPGLQYGHYQQQLPPEPRRGGILLRTLVGIAAIAVTVAAVAIAALAFQASSSVDKIDNALKGLDKATQGLRNAAAGLRAPTGP